MDLNLYKPTDIEIWINKNYQSSGINYAADMDIHRIAELFNIELHIYDGKSLADWSDESHQIILLNENHNEFKRRAEFFHELCHPLRHTGNQDGMNKAFMELQEIQAAQFQYYAAMPIYMLDEFKYVSPSILEKVLSEAFMLPENFVNRRLEQIKNRMYWHEQDKQLKERLARKITITRQDFQDFIAETHRRYDERYGKRNEDTCLL